MLRLFSAGVVVSVLAILGLAHGLQTTDGSESSLEKRSDSDTKGSLSNSPGNVPRPFEVDVSGSGRPVILIPGLACGGDVWTETVAQLQDQYECHVITLAGFAGQPAIDPPLLPTFRDGILEYISRQDLERPVLIGHSLGGFLAFWVAATAPKSVGPVISVDGLPFYSALDDPRATPESVEQSAIRKRELIQNASRLRRVIQNRAYLASRVSSSKDLQRVAAESDQSDPLAVGQAMYEMLTTDIRDELFQIQTPALLIGAAGSNADPKKLQTKQKRYRKQVATIPDHRVVFHSKSRHFIQFDAPEWLWDQMETFLESCEAQ